MKSEPTTADLVAAAVAKVNAVRTYWEQWVILVVLTTFDFMMLGHFGDPISETFGPLAATMRAAGVHGAIWWSRAVVYPYLLLTMFLPRCRAVNYVMIALNVLYATALLDYFYATGLIPGPTRGAH